MKMDIAVSHDQYADLSLKKQQVFRRYASGELTWGQVVEQIETIQPPPPNLSRIEMLGVYLAMMLLAVCSPPWARRGA